MPEMKKTDEKKQILRAWMLVGQTGLLILTSAGLGLAIGLFLDHTFSWRYMPATIGLTLWGLISGCYRAYRLIAASMGHNDEDNLAGVYDRLQQDRTEDEDEER